MSREWKKTSRRVITKTRSARKRYFSSVAILAVVVMIMLVSSATSFVSADYAPSYCVISDVHVNSISPVGYTSTIVQVIVTFYISCTGGIAGTVWDIQTKVNAESNLVGVTTLSSSDNQYSYGQGNVQYVVNNKFDAMNYYGYGEQTPSFYVTITAINTSTGSLDAQEEAPFAVDTSQYPFNLVQQNYCNFPGLSQFFQLLPGCGGLTNSTISPGQASSNCNTFGLPQFFQQFLPSCSTSETEPSNESSNQPSAQQPGSSLNPPGTSPLVVTNASHFSEDSLEWISGIIVAASATFLVAILVAIRTGQITQSDFHTRRRRQGKFCTACGMCLEASQNFCGRCGEASPVGTEVP